MWHGDPELTANVYTDPALQDVAAALDSLQTLPLDDEPRREPATGTGGRFLAATLAVASGKQDAGESMPDRRFLVSIATDAAASRLSVEICHTPLSAGKSR